jgi:hypothetical protein
MNRYIKWVESPQDSKTLLSKPTTPFDKGQMERPLRITFHSSALKELSEFEKAALDVLREFASIESPNLLALDTEPGVLPFIEIGNQLSGDYIPVTIRYAEEQTRIAGMMFLNQLPDLAAYMVNNLGGDSSNHNQALQDLMIAIANHSVCQDILITSSKWLLGNKEIAFVDDANPCLPSEALKIMGLLFRVHGDFRYAGIDRCPKWLFYKRLINHKLPSMGKYFNACLYSSTLRPDDITDITILGQSIFQRCIRAIQAHDEIGRLFYVEQNNEIRDEAMYHFDYLTLLLSGVLDAQARVAYRAYVGPDSDKSTVSFRNSGFVDKLDPSFVAFLKSSYFEDISNIISKMRNTIHGAGLTTFAYNKANSQKSFVQIPDIDAQKIWNTTESYDSAIKWGLQKFPDNTIAFEPYAFSQQLIDRTLDIVNTIASLTQVEKLFPLGAEVPDLNNQPNDDRTFELNELKIGERIALLA